MSAIAQYLKGTGLHVAGSDRLFCPGNKMLIQEQFENLGIHCFSQDGSGITPDTEVVVVSTAIEENNLEYRKAKELGIPLMKRSELLAAVSNGTRTIAVGGTSGKSTTTAMILFVFKKPGFFYSSYFIFRAYENIFILPYFCTIKKFTFHVDK